MAFSLFKSKPSILVPLFFLLLLESLYQPSYGFPRYDPEDSSNRRLFGSRPKQLPNCGELVSQNQCSQNSKCIWCKSEDLDDTCFGKAEAWRLPRQVFSCG
ncbi:hypothetical protein L6164_017363 [Bauhinia variegata]|uniref:Uncharacterized protein n=1 Tax=Bauhinia variegata TaxID=167791 RepID=A0ACB9N7N4_BAUVA|nr:hypothetical protein L6164_017363 [Bauhinia variegata]